MSYEYPDVCSGCGEDIDTDGIDTNGSRHCDDALTTPHTPDNQNG